MQHVRVIKAEKRIPAGRSVRVLMLNDGSDLAARERLIELGGDVDLQTELYTALSTMIDDPLDYGVFVMEVDAFGGLAAGLRAVRMLRAAEVRVPVILIGRDCTSQVFPEERSAPVMLKAPLSMVSLRVGFEHALQDRMIWRVA